MHVNYPYLRKGAKLSTLQVWALISDKKKLKEFIITKPVLHEMLKGQKEERRRRRGEKGGGTRKEDKKKHE